MEQKTPLSLAQYRSIISVDDDFKINGVAIKSEKEAQVLIDELLNFLTLETGCHGEIPLQKDKRKQLKALLTVRRPNILPDWFHLGMDRLLQWELGHKNIMDAQKLPRISASMPDSPYPAAAQCALWHGDITTLRADAIINAANSQLLGCFSPFHACIDNVIHAAAGPRLRLDCQTIMSEQGSPEKTGIAKITRGYNLPSGFVLHTVGPIFKKQSLVPSGKQKEQLASCYRSCLDLSSQIPGITSIAFCAVSTGIFGFPPGTAARIALETAADWLKRHPGKIDLVVFNVYTTPDLSIYQKTLMEAF